ncbi:hypothetical protein ACJX0J_011929 [Zea mays]
MGKTNLQTNVYLFSFFWILHYNAAAARVFTCVSTHEYNSAITHMLKHREVLQHAYFCGRKTNHLIDSLVYGSTDEQSLIFEYYQLISAFLKNSSLTEIVVTATTCTQFTLYNISNQHLLGDPIELATQWKSGINKVKVDFLKTLIVEVEENSRSSIEHRRVTKKFKIFKIALFCHIC